MYAKYVFYLWKASEILTPRQLLWLESVRTWERYPAKFDAGNIGNIGIASIEVGYTLRAFDPREVKAAQNLIAQSREVWLVADGDKFGREAPARILKTHAVEVT